MLGMVKLTSLINCYPVAREVLTKQTMPSPGKQFILCREILLNNWVQAISHCLLNTAYSYQ